MKYFITNKDTSFNMPWQEFKQLLASKGFIQAMRYDVMHNVMGKAYIDEFVIYYNPIKGMIIEADSYNNKKDINGGSLYAEIQANDKESSKIIWEHISTGGLIDSENLIFETSRDVREKLFSELDILESAGKFLPKWINKNRFLWFVDYVENKVPNYDYKKITREKLLKCPKEMREIVGI